MKEVRYWCDVCTHEYDPEKYKDYGFQGGVDIDIAHPVVGNPHVKFKYVCPKCMKKVYNALKPLVLPIILSCGKGFSLETQKELKEKNND